MGEEEPTPLTAAELAERFTSDRRLVYLCEQGVDCRSEVLTPGQYLCATERLLESHDPQEISDMLPVGSKGGPLDEIGHLLTGAAEACVEPSAPRETTTTGAAPPSTAPRVEEEVTTTTSEAVPPEDDDEEALAGMRDALVDLLIQRGADPAEAEVEADRLMSEGADSERVTEVMDKQLEIYEDWMENYYLHPVLGVLWAEEEATCAIIEMMKQSGVYGTERLLIIANDGGMDEEDALALVQPIADCVDLRAMTLEEMKLGGVDNAECLLGNVSEEQIVLWHVAEFTDGRAGHRNAVDGDVDLSCT
jgi:hypothetical protein